MSRLQAIQSNAATGRAKELLDAVEAKLKIIPNMPRVMANSPAVLEAYLGFSGRAESRDLGREAAGRNCLGSRRTEFLPVLCICAHGDRQNERHDRL